MRRRLAIVLFIWSALLMLHVCASADDKTAAPPKVLPPAYMPPGVRQRAGRHLETLQRLKPITEWSTGTAAGGRTIRRLGHGSRQLGPDVEDLLLPQLQFDLAAPEAALLPVQVPRTPALQGPVTKHPRQQSDVAGPTAPTPTQKPASRRLPNVDEIEDLLIPPLTDNTTHPAREQLPPARHPQGVPTQSLKVPTGEHQDSTPPQSSSRQPTDDAVEDLLIRELPDQGAAQGPVQTRPPAAPDIHQPGASVHGSQAKSNPPASLDKDPHVDLYAHTPYPSAKSCRKCHEKIYDEWSISSHAYASVSPMFQRFEQTLSTLTKGTLGYFCMRCHAPVATTLNHPRDLSIWEDIPAAHEGVTCITCHRVREHYTKVNGERRIEPGDIFDPVYGSGYGEGLNEVLSKPSHYKVKTSYADKSPGQEIHNRVIHFDQLSASEFCVSCHQVAVYPGIKLEVVWEQYRASPACKKGISCQDCHMGVEPGMAQGYEYGPVAVVNDKEISPHRKHSNHTFYGPGYSIAHPGLFPFNPKADEYDWTYADWLQFDWRAGWGTKAFEDAIDDNRIQMAFPKTWAEADDRYDAREIIETNLKKLEIKRQTRHRLMENGSELTGPFFDRQPHRNAPLKFHYVVKNTNLGHNMPSGSLGAQPQLWLNVVLTGPRGQRVWESGYVDRNGDTADLHSLEVAAGRISRDQQLVSFQTKFLISHVKGPDREMYLPVNIDLDQSPFIRPSAFPISTLNHPPTIRMEGHSLAPLGSRKAKYKVPAQRMTEPGVYRLSVRMRSRAEPIYFMRFCGSTPEMERSMNETMLDFHEETHTFVVP